MEMKKTSYSNEAVLVGPFHQLITMDGLCPRGPLDDSDLQIIDNAGIIMQNGIIDAVGRYADLDDFAGKRLEIDFPSVVLPGFVDAHTHICFAGSRAEEYALKLGGSTYQEIAMSGGGIKNTVKQTRAASFEELLQGVLSRTSRMLSRGVTTCEVKSGYGLTVESEVKMLKIIANAEQIQPVSLIPTCLAAHLKPEEFETARSYLDYLIKNLFPILIESKLSKRIDIFVEKGAFSVDDARYYLQKAKEKRFDLVIHGDQFSQGGARLAAEIGALSVDHLEETGIEDIKHLVESNVIPIALPGASLGLGMKFAPAKKLLWEGLSLVIASDWNPGSAPMGDLLTEAAILSSYEKLTMAETFAAITARAASALKLSDRGILKPGMRADFSVFPTGKYQEILYHQGTLTPHMVFTGGEATYAV
jgi:imidazolonepropionase